MAYGDVAYSLADTVGGAVVISTAETVLPTINMRINYLAPATGEDLRAEADVARLGNSVTTATSRSRTARGR